MTVGCGAGCWRDALYDSATAFAWPPRLLDALALAVDAAAATETDRRRRSALYRAVYCLRDAADAMDAVQAAYRKETQ